MSLEQQLIDHEGLKLTPYICPAGFLTVGVGRNLVSKGLSENEKRALNVQNPEDLRGRWISLESAGLLLRNDIEDVHSRLRGLDWFDRLDWIRQRVLIDMGFNLGISGLMGFKRMIAALKVGDFQEAAREMMDSKWARQVPNRANRLRKMMLTGRV